MRTHVVIEDLAGAAGRLLASERVRTAAIAVTIVAALATPVTAGCKKPPPAPPKAGWIQQEGWAGACYYPDDYASLGPGDRKISRQHALEAMMSQWTGSRNDGVSFSENVTENVETTLLGRPEHIEEVSQQNAKYCSDFMSGKDSGWSSWLSGLPKVLKAGECNEPLVDTYFNYLDIARSWQFKEPMCQGNIVKITASAIDYYRLEKTGPWINAAGDETQKTDGSSTLPCNFEGCYRGMVIMRFTGDSGVQQIHPVGLEYTFTAPEHGYIEVMMNDDSLEDDVYKVESGLTHHTSITYAPQ